MSDAMLPIEPPQAKVKPKPMTTRELTERLRTHYTSDPDSPNWQGGVFVAEVGINGNATHDGQAVNRRVDAVYAGFTSASGRLLLGHEVKVSRSDWRAELAKVGKADFWHDNCHQWWIVAPSIEIVPPEELPDGWGLKVPRGSTMRSVVKATTRNVTPSWDALRSIWSALETARAQSIANGHRAERDRHQDQLADMRRQLSLAGAATRPEVARLSKILALADERAETGWAFHRLSDDEIADALADVATARAAANELLRLLAGEMDTLTRLAEPLHERRGVLKEIHQRVSSGGAA
jgi:hypothetical protein